MKKYILLIAGLSLFTAGITHSYRGYRGRGGYRRGYGRGYRRGYGRGYGYGYGSPYGYGYYGGYYDDPAYAAIPFALGTLGYLASEADRPREVNPANRYRSFTDNADEQYWVVTNNTSTDIIVVNDNGGPQKMITAGQTEEVRHPESFGFKILDAQTQQEIAQGSSEDHFISIDSGGWFGKVSIKTWN